MTHPHIHAPASSMRYEVSRIWILRKLVAIPTRITHPLTHAPVSTSETLLNVTRPTQEWRIRHMHTHAPASILRYDLSLMIDFFVVENITPLQSPKSRHSNSSVQIQIKPQSQIGICTARYREIWVSRCGGFLGGRNFISNLRNTSSGGTASRSVEESIGDTQNRQHTNHVNQ